MVEAGLSIIDGVINFFQNLFSGNFKGCWDSIKQIFENAIKLIWNWMQVQFAVNLPNMIKNFGKNFKLWIDDAWISIKKFFKNGADDVVNSAKQGFKNVLNGVKDRMKEVPKEVKNFMDEAVDKIKSINLKQIGKDLIQGLIDGVKSMGSKVIGTLGNIVKSGIDEAKKKLGIKSPSRVFRAIGEDTGQGLINGLENKEIDVKKASQRLSNGVISGYSANINTNFSKGLNGGNNANYTNGISLNIENFNNNTDKDIEYLANELAFYMRRKNIGIGGSY